MMLSFKPDSVRWSLKTFRKRPFDVFMTKELIFPINEDCLKMCLNKEGQTFKKYTFYFILYITNVPSLT